MNRKLVSGLFWVLLANLLVKPLWILGIEVGVQNAVGTEMYGFYFTIFNISYIFNILLDLGITNFNTRNIARHPKLIEKHLPGLLSIKLLLLVFYLVVTFSIGLIKGFSSEQFLLLAILTFNQFLNSMILYLRSNFEGLLLFKWDSLISVLDRVLMIVICGMMLWLPYSGEGSRMTVYSFALAQTAAYLVTAVLALTVLMRRHVSGFRFQVSGFKFNRRKRLFAIAILKQSLPFALLVLLMASYNRIDPILLEQLSTDGMGNMNAGIYAGAFRLLDALTMIAYLVSVPLLPIFSKLTKERSEGVRDGEIAETTKGMFAMIMVFAITAACSLACVANDIMALFYEENVEEYADVFRIVIFCIIPISTTYIFGTLLTAGGYLRKLNIFAACSLMANIGVNLLLIPRYGAVGSAWAGVTAQSLMAVAQIVAALKIFEIKLSWGYILKLTTFTLSIIACTLSTKFVVWWQTLLICGAVAMIMALALKLINIKEITKSIKNKDL
ncbi:MAG: oligosaccharide flippase family protein [Bacteroidales bacterium]|nr:oligosaccharide flippase family protein [Bacteroidales bacterium]